MEKKVLNQVFFFCLFYHKKGDTLLIYNQKDMIQQRLALESKKKKLDKKFINKI